jgi:uncharacterized protein YyaL (SSP411 family)
MTESRSHCSPTRCRARIAQSLALLTLLLAPLPGVVRSNPSDPTPVELALIPKQLPGGLERPLALRQQLAKALATRSSDDPPRTRNLRSDGTPLYSNRLLLENSPYLRQHAHNPVDWYPWGEDAFAAARALNRPILVSIGYSTCHWCHVMEEETFDDPDRVRFLNAHFIAIKVDRESRPDVDSIYMTAMHVLGQRGGWPLNVWLTPDGQPFYGGTYFPPEDRGGRRGFVSTLRAIQEAYSSTPERVVDQAQQLSERIADRLAGGPATATQIAPASVVDTAIATYAQRFDTEWGGIGSGTKFPSSLPLRLLLRRAATHGDSRAKDMAIRTLERMAQGGIHDQIGGGFHRYATERRWLIPHFEKMLYDNALVTLAYLDAAQLTGRDDFADVARTTLNYIEREMIAPGGAFFSATDADSPNEAGESEEGWFFTWTPSEIESIVGAKLAPTLITHYGVTQEGNLDGRNVLYRSTPAPEVEAQTPPTDAALEHARARLYEARAKRPPPLRDEKIIVAWNGLMISAFARAGFVFDEPRYVAHARSAANAILSHTDTDGRLHRIAMGGRFSGPAFVDDYAFLIAGLLDLYEAAREVRWMDAAIKLQAVLDRHYLDTQGGGYYRSASDGEKLLTREKPYDDGATPSGNSVAASNLLRLAEFTGNAQYAEQAEMLFSSAAEHLTQRPTSVSELLLALDAQHRPTQEIILILPSEGDAGRELIDALRRTYVANRIIAIVREGPEQDAHALRIPLLENKQALRGRATAYVCENRICALPTSDPAVLIEQITPGGKTQGKAPAHARANSAGVDYLRRQ